MNKDLECRQGSGCRCVQNWLPMVVGKQVLLSGMGFVPRHGFEPFRLQGMIHQFVNHVGCGVFLTFGNENYLYILCHFSLKPGRDLDNAIFDFGAKFNRLNGTPLFQLYSVWHC